MFKPVRIVAIAVCLSLAPLAGAGASELEQDSARSVSIEMLKAGGLYMLNAVLCNVDHTPMTERVYDVLDRNMKSRPDLELRASHEAMGLYMAEHASQEFIKDKKKCDPEALALAKVSFEDAARRLDDLPQAR